MKSFKGFRIEEEVSKRKMRDTLEQKKNGLGSSENSFLGF